jgi:hypothetical protein
MGLLAIDDVREGMILDADVVEDGQVLVRAGTELSGRHIKVFKSWGVANLPIRGKEREEVEQDFLSKIPQEVLKAAEAKARDTGRFLNTGRPLDQMLYQIHLRRLIETRKAV